MYSLLAAFCLTLSPIAATAQATAAPERALVLVYHGIGPHKPYWITPEQLEADFLYLQRNGYHPVRLSALSDYALRGAHLPTMPVLVTFDDGVESVYRYALPLTRRYRIPAVAFIVGSRIGAPGHLSAAQLREMRRTGLWEVGAHTYDLHRYVRGSHGYLPQLVNPQDGLRSHEAAIRRDIALEAAAFRRAGLPTPLAFAFPYGRHDATSLALLHDAYPILFDSRPALALPGRFLVPRVDATSGPLPRVLRTYARDLTRGGAPYAGSPGPGRRRTLAR